MKVSLTNLISLQSAAALILQMIEPGLNKQVFKYQMQAKGL